MQDKNRWLTSRVERGLSTSRVVVITGPRQSGKTTLVKHLLASSGTFRRLDDETTLQAARNDPAGFVRYGPTPRAIDEIQLGGDALVRAVKTVVDDDRSTGQFILDGSADFLTVPGLSESLAGRAAFYELWPFSQGEIEGVRDAFTQRAFTEPEVFRTLAPSRISTGDYLERVCAGGFPEAYPLPESDRADWLDGLIRTVTQRDIAAVTDARRTTQLPLLLRLLAARTAGELVTSQVHADSGLGRDTTADYIGFLEMTYLVHRLPCWSSNLTNRVKRTPKIYITDTGLASHLLGVDPARLDVPEDTRRGPLIETFVVNEIRKQLAWSGVRAEMFHFRDRNGYEVDLILQTPDGRVVAIEVKSAQTVTKRDFKHLAWLRDRLGASFVHGYVVNLSGAPLAFGDRLTAVPLSYVWDG